MRKFALPFVLVFAGLTSPLATTAFCFSCASIQGGTITDSKGNPLETGYDVWGYNYQARVFNGLYDNFGRPNTPLDEESCSDCTSLQMKWNDAWLSNQDCNGDNKLDRASDFTTPNTYVGSGAWLTNHMSGSYPYVDDKGRDQDAHWTYFVKIVAVPVGATLSGGVYYDVDGTEIGPMVWNEFAIVQSVYNDPVGGFNGLDYLSPVNPGLGTR